MIDTKETVNGHAPPLASMRTSALGRSRMTHSRVIGALFLLGFLCYGIGSGLATSLVGGSNFLSTIGASQTLLSTVIGGTGAACFQYFPQTSTSGFTFVSNVGFTLSVQATRPDPQTLQYSQMTKSFLNLAPRNLLAGLEWANNNPGITPTLCANNPICRLQATPANVLTE